MYEEFIEQCGTTCERCGKQMSVRQSVNAETPEEEYAIYTCECGNIFEE